MPAIRPGPRDIGPRDAVVHLVLRHAGIGALLGLAFSVALVLLDSHGIARLMADGDSGIIAFMLLTVGFMVTFGSLVAGSAIMLIRDEDDEDGPGDGRRVPVRVVARRRSGR